MLAKHSSLRQTHIPSRFRTTLLLNFVDEIGPRQAETCLFGILGMQKCGPKIWKFRFVGEKWKLHIRYQIFKCSYYIFQKISFASF